MISPDPKGVSRLAMLRPLYDRAARAVREPSGRWLMKDSRAVRLRVRSPFPSNSVPLFSEEI